MPKPKQLTTTTATNRRQKQPITTPLRRSPRILGLKPPTSTKIHAFCPQQPTETSRSIVGQIPALALRRSPRLNNNDTQISKSNQSLELYAVSASGSRKSPTFTNVAEGILCIRQSARLQKANKPENGKCEKKFVNLVSNDEGVLSNKVKGKAFAGLSEVVVKRSKVSIENGCVEIVVGLRAGNGGGGDGCGRGKEVKVTRKRKRGEEGIGKGSVHGWTKEQELALERAYFAAKPTPHFWKKVSKLVPGKSALDCFDKIHSDHITPPQPLPQSRAKIIDSSPLGCFSLSASKLLKPSGMKIKGMNCTKRKSRLAHKTVRHLLQKCNRVDQDFEADLFSIFEPNINPSIQDSLLNLVLTTPKQLQEKQGFLQKCHEICSGRKRTLSRCSSSQRTDIVSPPVLKQVKNKALHEKYIDQLHNREAKRQATCACSGKFNTGKENKELINMQKTDVVQAAKNALVSDASDAIKQFQHLQANDIANSSDFDDDLVDSGDDEGESRL